MKSLTEPNKTRKKTPPKKGVNGRIFEYGNGA
jgi:hypothetical protein